MKNIMMCTIIVCTITSSSFCMLARLNSLQIAAKRANIHSMKRMYCTKAEDSPELKYEKIAQNILNGGRYRSRRSDFAIKVWGDDASIKRVQNNQNSPCSSYDVQQHQYLYYYGAHSPLSPENLLRSGMSEATHNSCNNFTDDNGSFNTSDDNTSGTTN